MQTKIQNPVLTGFNPDPCILRVGKKYYLATSTFEYFPGVQIYESDDLAEWRVIARPVVRDKEDMTGVPQGGGVWAPCLSYDGKRFYLVYSKMTVWSTDPYKDCENYVITAERPDGVWSAPVYLNSDGFDASLFHDGEKSYYMCMEWDYRKPFGSPQFTGILLWEFDRVTLSLKGEAKKIFRGTDRGSVEGPHIYKVGEYYYLFTAEGGTKEEHAETVARSKDVFGPYEVHPDKHLISSYMTDNLLQKAGHPSLTDDGEGNYYIAHLCGRKIASGNCVLGRETAIQNVVFRDGWPYLAHGGTQPRSFYTLPYAVEKKKKEGGRVEFNDYTLKNVYQSLRLPLDGKCKVISPRSVELTGGESIVSLHGQTLLAVRQTDPAFAADFCMDFVPEKFSHLAGLIYRYNEANQYLLYVSYNEERGSAMLYVQSFRRGVYSYMDSGIPVGSRVWLRVEATPDGGQFCYSSDGKQYFPVGEKLDVSVLSDEAASPMGFTGAFVGMYVGDLSARKKVARFTDFRYIPR